MQFRCDTWEPLLKLLGHVASVTSYALSSMYDTFDKFWFACAYSEPEISNCPDGYYKLHYRVGMKRYVIFHKIPPPQDGGEKARSRIVGARIFRPEASIQIKSIIQELAGPWGDFMGAKVTGRHILDHFVQIEDLSGFTPESWVNEGKVELTFLDGSNDNGTPKLYTLVIGMGELINP